MNSLPSSALAWEMPQVMAGEHQHHRCEVKPFQIGQAAARDPVAGRLHAALLHAAMHDQCRNGIRQLIRLLVDAAGCRPALEAIIGWHLPLANERERRSTYPARRRGVSSVSRA